MNMKNIINRATYIEQVKPFIKKNIVKVLTGQRRVGKSFLLLQLIETIKLTVENANIVHVNCENMAFDFIDSAKSLHDYIISKSNPDIENFIFIDEIQEIPEFEKAIRSLLLNSNNDIYITGSNANFLSSELATYLSGRYVEFQVFSLSFEEFLIFHKLEHTMESYRLYAKFGGLPYLKHLNLVENEVADYLNSIYNTVIYRDVVSRYNIRNTNFLERLTWFLADNIGSLFSAKKISDYLKSQKTNMSVNLVQNFTSHLSSAFIINEAERYDIKGKRIFEIGSKYYFTDLGIRNSISGFRLTDNAKILENIVYNHLNFRGYDVKVGNLDSLEIDFVCEKNGEKLYVQVSQTLKEDKTIEREFGNLLKIADNFPKIVVSEDEFFGNSYEGIKHVFILDFFKDY